MEVNDDIITAKKEIIITLVDQIVDHNKGKWFMHLIAEQDRDFNFIIQKMMPFRHTTSYFNTVDSEAFVDDIEANVPTEMLRTRKEMRALRELNEKNRYQEWLLRKYKLSGRMYLAGILASLETMLSTSVAVALGKTVCV